MTTFGGKKKFKGARFDITKVDVEHFLEVMRVENLTSATEFEWQFSCPFPGHAHGDQSPSAYMNKESTAWMCHGCKRSGNSITFLQEMENITLQEARAMLQLQYGGKSPDPDQYSAVAELERYWEKQKRHEAEPPNEILDEKLVEDYALDWSAAEEADPDEVPEEMQYMFDRGFSGATLDEWDVGIDYRVERIAIPVRNASALLVGFKGRAWSPNHKPKYLVMGGNYYDYPRFYKSQVVFGLDRVIAKYSEPKRLIIVEGELDTISMHSKGFDTTVCVAGSDFSVKQARLIRRWAQSATIFFDSDEGGTFGIKKVVEFLTPHIPLRVVPDHEGDPAEMTTSEIQELLDESETVAKATLLAKEQ